MRLIKPMAQNQVIMKKIGYLVLLASILILTSCSIADDIKDTADALECANLISKLDDDIDNNEDCSKIISDINSILSGPCEEFITSEQRSQFEFVRDNCEDN